MARQFYVLRGGSEAAARGAAASLSMSFYEMPAAEQTLAPTAVHSAPLSTNLSAMTV